MRSDGGVEEDIENTEAWADEASGRSRFKSIEIKEVNGKKRVVMHSLSGHERNKLFLNFGGNDFSNASPLSGLDSVSDGRSFGLFDLDHDGWQDIALVNTNFPRIQIFRNNMGTMNEAKNSFVVIQLVGGNWSGEPNQNFSNRDGVGAKIIVETERQRLVREIRCGEGFSSQNSKNLIVGIGAATTVNRIQVNWPSGIQQEIKNVQSEQLVKFLEDQSNSGSTDGVFLSKYPQKSADTAKDLNLAGVSENPEGNQAGRSLFELREILEDEKENLRVYITMATWCQSCKSHLPEIGQLSERIEGMAEIYGIPVDVKDSVQILDDYAEKNDLPYNLLSQIGENKRRAINEFIYRELDTDAMPATVITDSTGRILATQSGIPTASSVRRLLD